MRRLYVGNNLESFTFDHFDADKIIDKMMMGRKWGQLINISMTKEEIKKMWEEMEKASTAGIKMHYDIECYYNDMDVEVEEDCLEWKYFEEFEKEIGGSKEPYRTEWMIWDKELKFGVLLTTYINKDGTMIFMIGRSVGIRMIINGKVH